MPRKKKTIEDKVKQGLMDLAFGDISDAVKLLYLSDEEILESLPKLNLFNISEIKRPKGGGMEIKFFDRLKAIERLSISTEQKQDGGFSFYEALTKGAENLRDGAIDDRI